MAQYQPNFQQSSAQQSASQLSNIVTAQSNYNITFGNIAPPVDISLLSTTSAWTDCGITVDDVIITPISSTQTQVTFPLATCEQPGTFYYTIFSEANGCEFTGSFQYSPSLPPTEEADIYGCMDYMANNYNQNANIHDQGSCIYDVLGCTDPEASNYDPLANIDNGSCINETSSCTLQVGVSPFSAGDDDELFPGDHWVAPLPDGDGMSVQIGIGDEFGNNHYCPAELTPLDSTMGGNDAWNGRNIYYEQLGGTVTYGPWTPGTVMTTQHDCHFVFGVESPGTYYFQIENTTTGCIGIFNITLPFVPTNQANEPVGGNADIVSCSC